MKRFKLKVGVDWDEVLCECISYAIRLVNKKKAVSPPLDISEFDTWGKETNRTKEVYSYFKDPFFYETQPLMNGAKEFIHELSRRADVYFVTAAAPEFMGIRAKRILAEFPETAPDHIIMGSAKELVGLDILLDDGAHNIVSSNAAYPVLFRQPWNAHLSGCLSVGNYGEFLAFVDTVLSTRSDLPEGKFKVVALVGPSGSGKTAILNAAEKSDTLKIARSSTTRKPRTGEPKDAYYFVSRKNFLKQKSDFFETTVYAGEYYGSSKTEVSNILVHSHCGMAVDICGALALKRAFPENAVLIFVKRPIEDLVAAILRRKVSDEEKVRRICSLSSELRNEELCDFTIENTGTIEGAAGQVLNLIA